MHRTVMLTLLFALVATPLLGATLFDNFGPGDAYDPATYMILYHDPNVLPNGDEEVHQVGMAFTPSGGDYELGTVVVALSITAGDNEADIQIMTDVAGEPGAVLETWHVSGLIPPSPGVFAPLTLSSTVLPLLTDGTQYWIVVTATGPTASNLGWPFNTVGYTGLGAGRTLTNGVGSWNASLGYPAAMRVTGQLQAVGNAEAAWGEVKVLYR